MPCPMLPPSLHNHTQGQALLAAEESDAALRRLLPRTSREPTAAVLLTGLTSQTTETMVRWLSKQG